MATENDTQFPGSYSCSIGRVIACLSGKPENVGEFCSCQGIVRKLAFCRGYAREKIGKIIIVFNEHTSVN